MHISDQLADIGRINVGDILRRSAAKFPDRTAVDDGLRSLTYAQLQSEVNKTARGLLDRGLSPLDFVAVMGGNRVETVQSYLACREPGSSPYP